MKTVYQTLLILCLPACGFPQQVELPDWTNHQKTEPIELPDRFHGLVQDDDKQPIAGAKVELTIRVQLYIVGGIHEKDLYSVKTETDAVGKWSVPTEKIPRFAHRPLSVVVTASAPALVAKRTWVWFGPSSKKVPARVQALTLKTGHRIAGKCVDQDGKPAARARFRLYNGGSGWGKTRYQCNERGEFSFVIPKEGQTGYWIVEENLAPEVLRGSNSVDREPDLHTNVWFQFDRVRSEHGWQPVADAVVQATSVKDGTIRAFTLPFVATRRTDTQGRFRLPPLAGEYKILLTSAGTLADGSTWESPRLAPLMVPELRELTAGREAVILKASETVVVSGTVRWPDKTPADRSIVEASKMPDGNGVGIQIGHAVTDENGRYTLRIPVPLKNFLITANWRKHKGKSVRPDAVGGSEVFKFHSEYATAKEITEDATANFAFTSEKRK